MKIWFDLCEPKAVKMLRPLYERLVQEHEIVITARDFDSTYSLLDAWGKPYHKIGKHGGNTLPGKLSSYSERLAMLVDFAIREKPSFLFGLTTPEGLRVSFGLQIPNIIFNDEPRSVGVVKLSLPFVNDLIVPEPIPTEWYTPYGIADKNIHKFHGIDEVAETQDFKPDKRVIDTQGLVPGEYVIIRPEQPAAQYHMNQLHEGESKIPNLIDPLLKAYPNFTYLIVPRNAAQRKMLEKKYKGNNNVVFRDYLDPIAQFLYHARLVVTAGGSFVRQSALMNVPSVEYFPLGLYPQEKFLIDAGFPLAFVQDLNQHSEICVEMLNQHPAPQASLEKVKSLENPIDVALNLFKRAYGTNASPA